MLHACMCTKHIICVHNTCQMLVYTLLRIVYQLLLLSVWMCIRKNGILFEGKHHQQEDLAIASVNDWHRHPLSSTPRTILIDSDFIRHIFGSISPSVRDYRTKPEPTFDPHKCKTFLV